jgi:hypothetical protein
MLLRKAVLDQLVSMRHLCRLMVAASLPSYCCGNIAEFVYSRLLGTTCGIIADLV